MIHIQSLHENGTHFAASTNNNDLIDCHCYSNCCIAENWDVSIWKSNNPDGDVEELQNKLAQLCAISLHGPLKVYLKEEGYRGGYLVVTNDPEEVKNHNFYHEKDCDINYLTVFPWNSGYEFMGDS